MTLPPPAVQDGGGGVVKQRAQAHKKFYAEYR